MQNPLQYIKVMISPTFARAWLSYTEPQKDGNSFVSYLSYLWSLSSLCPIFLSRLSSNLAPPLPPGSALLSNLSIPRRPSPKLPPWFTLSTKRPVSLAPPLSISLLLSILKETVVKLHDGTDIIIGIHIRLLFALFSFSTRYVWKTLMHMKLQPWEIFDLDRWSDLGTKGKVLPQGIPWNTKALSHTIQELRLTLNFMKTNRQTGAKTTFPNPSIQFVCLGFMPLSTVFWIFNREFTNPCLWTIFNQFLTSPLSWLWRASRSAIPMILSAKEESHYYQFERIWSFVTRNKTRGPWWPCIAPLADTWYPFIPNITLLGKWFET